MKLHFSLSVFLCFLLVASFSNGCNKKDDQADPSKLPCLERAVFSDPEGSTYILPWSAGKSFQLIQSYCYTYGGHEDQLAYDFALTIGEPVTASRTGIVKEIREDLPDNGTASSPGAHNHIMILHADGTVAFYAHLKQNSVGVTEGDHVTEGDTIALSGNSGDTAGEPHLHFGVYQSWPATEGFDVPVNFKNCEGPLDERGGLKKGMFYKALAD